MKTIDQRLREKRAIKIEPVYLKHLDLYRGFREELADRGVIEIAKFHDVVKAIMADVVTDDMTRRQAVGAMLDYLEAMDEAIERWEEGHGRA